MRLTAKKTNNFLKVTITSILTWPAKLALGLFISIIIASSCADPSTIGLELDPNNNQIGVSFVEIPLSASVVLQDSLMTTNPRTFVFGSDESDFFGKTEARTYTRLFFNREIPRPAANAVLDSIKFNFNVGSVLADELDTEKTVRVHSLKEQLQDIVYYNFNFLEYDPEHFLEAKLDLSTRQDTIISVKAENDFTKKIFEDLKEGSAFQDIFTFRDYLPGIVFTGAENENASLSLIPGSNTGMVFFYRNAGDTVSRAYPIATGVNNNLARHFNQVKRNPEGTPTDALKETWVEYDLDGRVGAMNNTGIVIKIDMSPLDAFIDTLQNVTFNQVTLQLGPVVNVTDTRRPPQFLELAFTNDANRFIISNEGLIISIQPDTGTQFDPITGGPFVNQGQAPGLLVLNPENNKYDLFITRHVGAIYSRKIQRQDLILWPSYRTVRQGGAIEIRDEYRQSLRSYIFNSNDVKLKIYYSTTRVL